MKISLLTPTRGRPHAMRSGIYMILNLINGHRYIGSTNNFLNRARKHRTLMTTGKHPNKHLMNAFSLYGSNSFQFVVLEYAPVDRLLQIEQEYLNACYDNGVSCYNQSKEAQSAMKGRKHSLETLTKISGINNHRFGKRMSLHQKQLLSNMFTGSKRPDVSVRLKNNKLGAKLHDIKLISPTKEVHGPIFDLKEFCAIHKLDYRLVYRLIDGTRKSHKNWRVSK